MSLLQEKIYVSLIQVVTVFSVTARQQSTVVGQLSADRL